MILNYILQHADNAQQAFSSDQGPTLHLALPALEALHQAWSSRSEKPKYAYFAPALKEAVAKLKEYYDKTAESEVYIFSMCKLLILRQFRNLISTAVLDPDIKMSYFNKYWSPSLQKRVLHEAEKIVCPSILSFYNC